MPDQRPKWKGQFRWNTSDQSSVRINATTGMGAGHEMTDLNALLNYQADVDAGQKAILLNARVRSHAFSTQCFSMAIYLVACAAAGNTISDTVRDDATLLDGLYAKPLNFWQMTEWKPSRLISDNYFVADFDVLLDRQFIVNQLRNLQWSDSDEEEPEKHARVVYLLNRSTVDNDENVDVNVESIYQIDYNLGQSGLKNTR